MRHFRYLSQSERERLFLLPPEELFRTSHPNLLAVALGATLYAPANRPSLAKAVLKQTERGCISFVLCLEDSVADDDVAEAEANLLDALAELAAQPSGAVLPLLFIRCRTPEQLLNIGRRAGSTLDVLAGFVLPKFENETGQGLAFFEALRQLNHEAGRTEPTRKLPPLLAMPIIEDPVTTHLETRTAALHSALTVITTNRDLVLCIRVGATDMSGAFGLRRSRDLTIYDVNVVANVIGDVVNVFGRTGSSWVITGPVWEHFSNKERVLRPLLRVTPFSNVNEEALRQRLLLENLDGLIREIELDQANGLLGKTVIHPSHVPVVHSMSVVSHEEYLDATDIAAGLSGGVQASSYGNKMNEHKPHRSWAERTLLRARAFGVANHGISFAELLEASMK
ncbi:HpcH/HpaI aldolase/citrate lyase family protein [Arthrobacter sp. ISL-85]|uniref:HpcH/HpaI aldolase/citrate lyase family protein n=1 Tax=Arthrobacter sp. ISL-85 TaxID=2819115 RepID=UPI001BE7CCF5|nr:HpcH/HpaI aldolase/citrate lyase family protein [Arthrobacter sp. ISL-85]MBT2568668.1 HpcH/HpaI aldolase/citrate lyase family protein [Arthrobacter sp. ISL-85]